jgi:hypothetical protein
VSDQEAVADLLAPGRATELKRQRQAELAQALTAGPPRESDHADDVVLDQLADRIATKIIEKLDERMITDE